MLYFGLSERLKAGLVGLKDIRLGDGSLKLANVIVPCCCNKHYILSETVGVL